MVFLQTILNLAFLFLPQIFWEVPKTWFYFGFICLFSAFVIYTSKKVFKFNKYLIGSILLFLAVAYLSSFLGVDIKRSFMGNFYRADGIIVLTQMALLAVVLALRYDFGDFKNIALAIFVSGVIAPLIDNFGQPNYMAGYMMISMVFGLYLFTVEKKLISQFFIGFGILIHTWGIYITNSNVGLIGIVVIFAIWLSYFYSKKIAWFSFILALFASITVTYYWYMDLSTKTEYVAESRVRIYRNVLVGALNKPILGHGWSTTDYVFRSVQWPIKFNHDIYLDRAHMGFLDIFAWTGAFGLFIYLSIISLSVINLLRQKSFESKCMMVALLAYIIHAQTNITTVSQEFLFWFIISWSSRIGHDS